MSLPIDCMPGRDCFVQNYPDADPGPGYADYQCGRLSYDDHKGTDFRLPNLAAMRRGVAVVAAAPGVVRAVRDRMPDSGVRELGEAPVRGKEAGNAVAIRHGDGWETQYSHLRKGSVAVRPGQQVLAGQRLGLVGLSGNTEFPHLHFTVRHLGKTLDPFSGLPPGAGCGKPDVPLWDAPTRTLLAYRPSGILASGFADRAPTARTVRANPSAYDRVVAGSPALVFWVDAFGARKGDEETMRLSTTGGKVLANASRHLTRDQAVRFRFIGKRLKSGRWPAGIYVGEYTLRRQAPNGNYRAAIRLRKELEIP